MNRHGTVRTDQLGQTHIPGLFVVGDASRDVQFVIVAAAEGAKAAVAINAIVDAVTAASYPGTEDWSHYMIGSTPIENPMPYYERSIVNFVDTLRTPIVFLYARQNPSAPFQQLQQFAVQAEVKGRWYDYRVFENEFGGWRTWRSSNMRLALEGIEAVFEKYLQGRDREVRLSRNR